MSKDNTMRVIDQYPYLKSTKGDFGLEIEVEGYNLPRKIDKWWHVEQDGSLRGQENAEYVLNTPLNYVELKKALYHLKDCYKKAKARIDDTVTAGIHVHLNVQDNTLYEMVKIITLYYCLENLLIKYCGESREGNHFCLRAKDSDFIIDNIVTGLSTNRFNNLCIPDYRYSALNLASLSKFGSVEFRAFKTTDDMDNILEWCSILKTLKESALKYDSPIDIVINVSEIGVAGFITKTLKEHSKMFIENYDYESIVFEGMRSAQDIAFSCNWEDFIKYYTIDKNKKDKVEYGVDLPRPVRRFAVDEAGNIGVGGGGGFFNRARMDDLERMEAQWIAAHPPQMAPRAPNEDEDEPDEGDF